MIFFESALGIKIKQTSIKQSIDKIEMRLKIESEIISYYREKEEMDEITNQFEFDDINVTTVKIENKINVNISGAITHAFYYVIMEDGSFILTTVEEKYDNIK